MKNNALRFFPGIPVLLVLIFWVSSCTQTVSIDSYVFTLDDFDLPPSNDEQLGAVYSNLDASHTAGHRPLSKIYGNENPLYGFESPLLIKTDRLECTDGTYTPAGDIEFGGIRYTGNDIADIAKTSALSKLPARLYYPEFGSLSGNPLTIIAPVAAAAAGASIPAGAGNTRRYPAAGRLPSPKGWSPFVIKTDPAEWADFYIREVTSVFFVADLPVSWLRSIYQFNRENRDPDYTKLFAMAGIAMVRRNPDVLERENPEMIRFLDLTFPKGKRTDGHSYFVWFSLGYFPDYYKDLDLAIWYEWLMNAYTQKYLHDLTDTDGTTDINALTGISPESEFESEDAQANTAFFLKQKGEKLVVFDIPRYRRSVMNFCSAQAAADFREQLKEFFIREKTETEAEKAAFYETLKPLDLSILPPGSAHFFEPRLPQDRTADTP